MISRQTIFRTIFVGCFLVIFFGNFFVMNMRTVYYQEKGKHIDFYHRVSHLSCNSSASLRDKINSVAEVESDMHTFFTNEFKDELESNQENMCENVPSRLLFAWNKSITDLCNNNVYLFYVVSAIILAQIVELLLTVVCSIFKIKF